MPDHAAFLRAHSAPLAPEPTGLTPSLPVFDDIRSVAFDIYGTLFISGSGDIGHSDAAGKEQALRSILANHGIDPPSGDASLTDRFTAAIEADHARSRAAGIDFPEVEIRDIWRHVLGEGPADDDLESIAVAYENTCNPVWPMPGALDLLTGLRDRGLALAIVSNAQFYTPFLFEALLGSSLDALGFDPDLCFFSFRDKRAKPSPWLYEQLRDALLAQSVDPSQVLYIGNDALKDVHPAAQTGFRTALFAGDRRSLRLREDQPDLLPPDAVVTGLAQVSDLLGPGASSAQ